MIALRPYQADLLGRVMASYRSGHAAPLVQLPTGGGKTRIFCAAIERTLERNRQIGRESQVLLLAHRREIEEQISRQLDEMAIQHGRISAGHAYRHSLVQVASVQTLVRRLGMFRRAPGLIVIDEAHHAHRGNTWGKIIKHFESLGKVYLLGVTATPARLDGQGLGRDYQGYFDDLQKGPGPAELIKGGYLSNFVAYSHQPANFDRIKKRGGDFDAQETYRAMKQATVPVLGDPIDHWLTRAKGLPFVQFVTCLEHAREQTSEWQTRTGLRVEMVSGKNRREAGANIARFNNREIIGLVAVDLISEGLDVPPAKCAILTRPTASLILHLQQCGRILRPYENITAVILDHVGNITHRHGLPSEDRPWSLEGLPKQRPLPRVMRCPECERQHEPLARCPYCGHRYGREEIPAGFELNYEQGELIEVTPEMLAQRERAEKARFRQNRSGARTYGDLIRIADGQPGIKKKEGWAIHVIAARLKSMPLEQASAQALKLGVPDLDKFAVAHGQKQ